MKFQIGELVEWLGAGCLIVSAYLFAGAVLALALGGVWLVYYAQCLSDTTVTVGTNNKETNQQ